MANDDITRIDLGDTKIPEPSAELQTQLARRTRIEADSMEYDWNRLQASKDSARIYSFLGPVGLPSAQGCMDVLGQWYREDPHRDIQIVFNSPGGHVMDGLALYDYIRTLRDQHQGTISTHALGQAASMAAVLLQAGEERVMSKHAYLLIHEISSGAIGSFSELSDSVVFTERLQTRIVNILAERSSMTADEIKTKWERKDWWLDADEALELGFCDRIQ